MTKKYRPYFTLPELRILSSALAKSKDVSHESLSLYQYLTKYISDIESGFRTPNHTLVPSLSESLGLEPPRLPDIRIRDSLTLLDIYTVNGSFIGMSAPEIAALQRYRFENDHMSDEEEATYIISQTKPTGK